MRPQFNPELLMHFYNAVSDGNLQLVIALVESARVPIDTHYPDSGTALHLAIFLGHVDIVKYLVSKGAPLEVKDHGFTPLALAAYKPNVEICKILIEKGANLNFKYCGKLNFINFAISHDNCDMIDLALKHDSDINSENGSPLRSAIAESKYKSLQFLLERGADYRKYQKFHFCCGSFVTHPEFYHVFDCVKVNDGGRSLQILLSYIEKKEGKSCLIDYINHANPKYKLTALHAACSQQNEQAIKILIEMGADIEAKNWYRLTPLETVEMTYGRNAKSQRIKTLFEVNS